LGIGGVVHRCSGIDSHLQCSNKSRDRPLERQQPAGEVEREKKPLGVLSRFAVLATSDWFRTLVFSHNAEGTLMTIARTAQHGVKPNKWFNRRRQMG